MKYLYGAAVQGIQSFIFQTNELKDIVGASELVENICTELFTTVLKKNNVAKGESIIGAAGNIKYIFDSYEDCAKIVRIFPNEAIEYAPGITISQAVVEYEDDDNFAEKVNELEERLRMQRNKPMQNTQLGLMGVLRSRKTNMPVVYSEMVKGKIEYYDASTLSKRYEIVDGKKEKVRNVLKLAKIAFDNKDLRYGDVAINIEDMVGKNDWIAIIHADGNGLGQIVQKIGTDRIKYCNFSKKLDKATKDSAAEAFKSIKSKYSWKDEEGNDGVIPIRPIVLGGDDFTVICRADLAMEYVAEFIVNFEKNTDFEELEDVFLDNVKKLSVCAGISYIKSSYPFYYGYNLAEELCSRAKKDAKKGLKTEGDKSELPKSCVMFHKVQDSFVKDLKDIVARELTPQANVSFEFGPYYINTNIVHGEERWTVANLLENVERLAGKGLKDAKRSNAVKSHLRNWLSLLHDNPGMADQKLIRLKELLDTKNADDKSLRAFVENVTGYAEERIKTPVYDILALYTVYNQDTKG